MTPDVSTLTKVAALLSISLATAGAGAVMRSCAMSNEQMFAAALCRPGASSFPALASMTPWHCAGCVVLALGAIGTVLALALAARLLRPGPKAPRT